MSGLRGLRTINYRTERWTRALAVRAGDDEMSLKCVATVPGLRPYIETVQLNVDCKLLLSTSTALTAIPLYGSCLFLSEIKRISNKIN